MDTISAPVDTASKINDLQHVHARVGGPQWEAICRAMEEAFRHTEYRDGAINGIKAVAQHLKEHFAAYRDGQNELSDTPVVL